MKCCPKCQSPEVYNVVHEVRFKCGTSIDGDSLVQSDHCKTIAELNALKERHQKLKAASRSALGTVLGWLALTGKAVYSYDILELKRILEEEDAANDGTED